MRPFHSKSLNAQLIHSFGNAVWMTRPQAPWRLIKGMSAYNYRKDGSDRGRNESVGCASGRQFREGDAKRPEFQGIRQKRGTGSGNARPSEVEAGPTGPHNRRDEAQRKRSRSLAGGTVQAKRTRACKGARSRSHPPHWAEHGAPTRSLTG